MTNLESLELRACWEFILPKNRDRFWAKKAPFLSPKLVPRMTIGKQISKKL